MLIQNVGQDEPSSPTPCEAWTRCHGIAPHLVICVEPRNISRRRLAGRVAGLTVDELQGGVSYLMTSRSFADPAGSPLAG